MQSNKISDILTSHAYNAWESYNVEKVINI